MIIFIYKYVLQPFVEGRNFHILRKIKLLRLILNEGSDPFEVNLSPENKAGCRYMFVGNGKKTRRKLRKASKGATFNCQYLLIGFYCLLPSLPSIHFVPYDLYDLNFDCQFSRKKSS
jgi:hypothetical protein